MNRITFEFEYALSHAVGVRQERGSVMGWNDFYARRDVMDTVLELAKRDPAGPLPYGEIERAEELFGTPERLLLALYYRWTQLLGGYLRAEVAGPEDSYDAPPPEESDHADRVAAAWGTAVTEHPTLRAVLDANIDRYPETLVPALESEQRMLAITAGLAEPHEPVEEVTRVGAGFMALLRQGRSEERRRTGSVGQLLRLLSPAG